MNMTNGSQYGVKNTGADSTVGSTQTLTAKSNNWDTKIMNNMNDKH